MRIKWLHNIELSVVYSFDERNEIANEGTEIVEKDEVNEVDLLEDKGKTVDIQFGNGWMAFNVSKKWFAVVDT